ncbi:MAG: hypothetical protein LBP64_04230 [Tannerella sp.]|jgi:hypothetical protein|nr:hypothetical protein [Tannerella sp.]
MYTDNLHLFLQHPDDGINSPFPGKDEKSTRVFEINTRGHKANTRELETNTREDSGVFHAPEVLLPVRTTVAGTEDRGFQPVEISYPIYIINNNHLK